MSFERLFERDTDIPFGVAAAAYLAFTKQAGVEDPPDETGALEGQFAVPIPTMLQAMSELVQNEFKGVYAYMLYANSLRSLSHHSLAEEFEGHMEDELGHADWLMRRMSVLGGPVHVPDIPPPPASADPAQIIKILIRMEQEGIAGWKKLLEMSGDNPQKVTIEDYLAKEQEHLDDLWQLLPSQAQSPVTPEKTAAPLFVDPYDAFGVETYEATKEKTHEGRRALALQLAEAEAKDWQGRADWSAKHPVLNRVRGGAAAAIPAAAIGAGVGYLAKGHPGLGALAGGALGAGLGALVTSTPQHQAQIAAELAHHAGTLRTDPHALDVLLHRALIDRLALDPNDSHAYDALHETAQRKHAADKSDDEAAEAGRKRAIGNAASEFEKNRHHKSERMGELIGRLLGSGAGAGSSLAATRGAPGWQKALAATAGTVVGGASGGRVGKHLGQGFDEKRFNERFKKAMLRAGFTKGASVEIKDIAPAGIQPEDAVPAQLVPPPVGQPMTTGFQGLSPETIALLQGEQMAQMAQEQGELEYFRDLAQQERARADQAEQQAQSATEQVQQLQEQSQAAMDQATQVRDQAMQSAQMAHSVAAQAQQGQLDSMNEALARKQETTQVSTAHQVMKSQIMDAVAQDPMPPVQMAPPPIDPSMLAQDPSMQGQAPPEAAPQGAPAQPSQPTAKQAAAFDVIRQALNPESRKAMLSAGLKAAPFAAAGAALGAGNALLMRGRNADKSRARVQELEQKGDQGFSAAVALAKAKAVNSFNELADQYPAQTTAASALLGASALGTLGPPAYDLGKYLVTNLRNKG